MGVIDRLFGRGREHERTLEPEDIGRDMRIIRDGGNTNDMSDRRLAAAALTYGLAGLVGVDEDQAVTLAAEMIGRCWVDVEACEPSELMRGDMIRLTRDGQSVFIRFARVSRSHGRIEALCDDRGRVWWLDDWTLVGRLI